MSGKNDRSQHRSHDRAGSFGAVTLLVLRIFAGGLFVIAGWIKVNDPHSFYDAIGGFDIVPKGAEHLKVVAAFAIPWAELICGAMILLGLGTRSASLLATVLLLVFMGGIASVMLRDVHTSCGCFGKLDFLCTGPIGECHLIRNGVHAATLVALVLAGGGRISFDRLVSRAEGSGRGEPGAGSGAGPGDGSGAGDGGAGLRGAGAV